MMKKALNRVLSFVLAFVMTASLLLAGVPAPAAYAAPNTELKVTLSCTNKSEYSVHVDNASAATVELEPSEYSIANGNGTANQTITGSGDGLIKVTVTVDGIVFTFSEGVNIPTDGGSTDLTADIRPEDSYQTELVVGEGVSLKPVSNATGVSLSEAAKITWEKQGGDSDPIRVSEGTVTASNAMPSSEAKIIAKLQNSDGSTTYATAEYTGFTAKEAAPGNIVANTTIVGNTTYGEPQTVEFKFTGGYGLTQPFCMSLVTVTGADGDSPSSFTSEGTPATSATLTYTFSGDSTNNKKACSYGITGKGEVTTFYIDAKDPSATTIQVEQQTKGFSAKVTPDENGTVSVKFAESNEGYGDGVPCTAGIPVTIPDETAHAGQKAFIKVTDAVGRSKEYESEKLITAELADPDTLDSVEHDGKYYVSDKTQLKFKLTTGEAVANLSAGKSTFDLGGTKYNITGSGTNWTVDLSSVAEGVLDLSSAKLIYGPSEYNQVTINVDKKTTKDYVVDSEKPTVTFTVNDSTGEWYDFGESGEAYIFPASGKMEKAPDKITLKVTVKDANFDDTVDSGGWTKDEDGSYFKNVEFEVKSGKIALNDFLASIKDKAGNGPEGATVGETKLGSLNQLTVQTDWPADTKLAQPTVTFESAGLSEKDGIYNEKLVFKVHFDDFDKIKDSIFAIRYFYNTDGSETYLSVPDTATVTWPQKGDSSLSNDYTVELPLNAFDGGTIEGDHFKFKVEVDQHVNLGDDGSTGDFTFPGATDGNLQVDNKDPEVTITWAALDDPDAEVAHPDNGGVYKPRKVTITVTDLHFDESNTVVTAANGDVDVNWAHEGNTWTKTVTFDQNGNATFSVTVKDTAGHQVEYPERPETEYSFIIDKDAPDITVKWTDSADTDLGTDMTPKSNNGGYFDKELIATVTVKDANLDPSTISVHGGVGEGSWATTNPGEYTQKFRFTEGNDQNLTVSATDKAGNPSEKFESLFFHVDLTDPVVKVKFDNNTFVNGNYFTKQRTVTITVEEKNFDDTQKVKINGETLTWTKDASSASLPVYTATYTYDTDGDYFFDITVKDLAGRTNNDFTESETGQEFWHKETFIIDKTRPTVEVSLTGQDVTKVFQRPVYDPDEAFFGTDKDNYTDVYFVQLKQPVEDGTQVDPAELGLQITVTDDNLALLDGSFGVSGTITVGTKEGAKEYNITSLQPSDPVQVVKDVNKDGTRQDKFTITLDGQEVNVNETLSIQYELHVADQAGQTPERVSVPTNSSIDGTFAVEYVEETGVLSNKFSVDRRQPTSPDGDPNPPEIKIAVNTAPANESQTPLLYSEDVELAVTVTDGALDGINSGLKSVKQTSDKGILTGVFTGNAQSKTAVLTVSSGEDNESEINGIQVTVTAQDYVGNTIMQTVDMSIDKQAPRINVGFNNPNVLNGKYYQASRTATITVEDINFDPANTFIFTQQGAVPGSAGWTYDSVNGCYVGTLAAWSKNGDVYTATFTYGDSNGQDYTLRVESTDLTGDNTGTHDTTPAFVVDLKDPVLTVTYNNNDVRNGHYYNAGRTATVTITETNFGTGQGVEYHLTSNGAQPQLGGWTGNGDTHTATLNFSTDGDYSFTINYTDLSGRKIQAQFDSGLFTVDLTDPTVEISNIEDYSANRGEVAPVVRFEDTNFDRNGYHVQVTKIVDLTRHETVQLPNSVNETGTGAVISFSNLAETLENDGIYTLFATITDLAGNSSEASVTYSVNRKGSTYYAYDDPTIDLLEKVYSNQAPTLRIAEINPDSLTEYSVTISVNNSNTTLKEGTDYTVEQTGGRSSFKQYIYTINSSAFMKNSALAEGAYTIVLDSTDTAGNINSNRANENDLPINFTLDATPPNVSLIGVAEGDIIRAETRTVTVFFEDGYALSKVEILLNGEVIKTLEGQELAEAKGEYSFDVPQSTHSQDIQVLAYDAAGNEAEMEPVNFFLSSNLFWYIIHNTPLLLGIIAGVLLVIIIIILLIKRRKKEPTEESVAAGSR